MSELDEYRKLVERMANSRSHEVFNNGQAAHAAVIFETFLKMAKRRVNIFCRNLSSAVFTHPSMTERIEMALHNDVRVSIIHQETPESSELVTAIHKWRDSNLPIDLIDGSNHPAISLVMSNFAVMDKRAYRFEPDRKEPVAYACMNNCELARSLDDVFLRYQAALA